jgi:mannitol/fructose-specific phosphotransferase system IIA component (Ntr-type)
MNCKLSELILPQQMWMDFPSGTKQEVLKRISSLACAQLADAKSPLDESIVFSKLCEREQKASTGADHGLAIPHACLSECQESYLFFFRCQMGVQFNSMDGLPSQIFFLILAPEKRKTGEIGHLQILSSICRLMRHVGVREKILMASSKIEILELLRKNE